MRRRCQKKNIQNITFAIGNHGQMFSVLLAVTVRTSLPIHSQTSKKDPRMRYFTRNTCLPKKELFLLAVCYINYRKITTFGVRCQKIKKNIRNIKYLRLEIRTKVFRFALNYCSDSLPIIFETSKKRSIKKIYNNIFLFCFGLACFCCFFVCCFLLLRNIRFLVCICVISRNL